MFFARISTDAELDCIAAGEYCVIDLDCIGTNSYTPCRFLSGAFYMVAPKCILVLATPPPPDICTALTIINRYPGQTPLWKIIADLATNNRE